MDTEGQATPTIEKHAIAFGGSGRDYFRVWIVNVLLMVVTLGLYTPVARRRTLQYFFGHTLVAGSPLEFTGGLRRMVMGFLLFAGLYLAYEIASHTEQTFISAGIALVFLGGWPWLWASAVRFRLTSTRWRGVRGDFRARWGEVYGASWPLWAMALVFGAVGFLASLLKGGPGWTFGVLVLVALPAVVALGVRLEYNYARLRFTRGGFGGQPARWKVAFTDLLRISAQAFGIFMAIVLAIGGLVALLVFGVGSGLRQGRPGMGWVIVLPFVVLLFTMLAVSPVLAWRDARKFLLVWNSAGLGQVARLRCSLRPGAYVRLRIRNMLLTLLTLGFWRPFARVSEYRMKVDSVTLYVKGGLDQLVGRLVVEQDGAFADAMADGIGFDFAA